MIAVQAGVEGVRVDGVIMLEVVTDAPMLRLEELLEGHRKALPSARPPSFFLFSPVLEEVKRPQGVENLKVHCVCNSFDAAPFARRSRIVPVVAQAMRQKSPELKRFVRAPRVSLVFIFAGLASDTAVPLIRPGIPVLPLSFTPIVPDAVLQTCRTSHNAGHVEIAPASLLQDHRDALQSVTSLNQDGNGLGD